MSLQPGVAGYLVQPVHQDACRADHEKVALAIGAEVADGRQGFDGLAEPHLVTKHRSNLSQRVLRPERLVPPQRDAQQGCVERLIMNPGCDLGWKRTLHCVWLRAKLSDIDQKAVVGDGSLLVVLPKRPHVGGESMDRGQGIVETGSQDAHIG